MPVMAVCPNPECSADMVIPRRIGAHVRCEECDVEWIIEDLDPVELIPADDELDDWDADAGLASDELELDESPVAGDGWGRASVTAARPQTQWECTQCGTIAVGSRPPRKCSACGSGADAFLMLSDEDFDTSLEDADFDL